MLTLTLNISNAAINEITSLVWFNKPISKHWPIVGCSIKTKHENSGPLKVIKNIIYTANIKNKTVLQKGWIIFQSVSDIFKPFGLGSTTVNCHAGTLRSIPLHFGSLTKLCLPVYVIIQTCPVDQITRWSRP